MSPLIYGHLANLAFAAAYLVRDTRKLRMLSVVGCSLCAVFNYAAPETPLWTAITWNLFFAAVNVIALARLDAFVLQFVSHLRGRHLAAAHEDQVRQPQPMQETSSSGSQMDRNACPSSGTGIAPVRSDRAKAIEPTIALHWYALTLPPPR